MANRMALPQSRPPLVRMMRIHEELQDGRLTNCTKLAELLEVSTKTIARDLGFMGDRFGLPVEYDPRTYAWRYTTLKASTTQVALTSQTGASLDFSAAGVNKGQGNYYCKATSGTASTGPEAEARGK